MARNPFTEVAGLLGPSSGSVDQLLTGQLTTIATQFEELESVNQAQMTNVEASTGTSSSAKSSGGSIGGTLLDMSGLGSGMGPLISGLMGLFGSGEGSSTATVTPYIQPLPINLQAGFNGSNAGGASGVDYSEGGQPRQTTAASAQQITVQVQAMD
ncbi:MAG: hypothetical protein ABSF22_19020, partial [Bryobacteraceae bacterium]